MSGLPKPLRITEAGRETVARAVAIDWDWALPASSADKLVEALANLGDDDLEAAYEFAYHLREATGSLLIRRDMQRREGTQ